MVPRPLAAARAMRSRTCADVIQPCCPSQQNYHKVIPKPPRPGLRARPWERG